MRFLTPRFYGILTLLWVAIMLVLTLTPAQEMPHTPEWEFLSFDTAAHAGVFAVLAGLAWLWARRQPGQPGRAAWLVLAGCVAFGALIEGLQYAMHAGRHAEWSDLLGDSLGAALGLALVVAAAGRTGRSAAALAVGLLLLPTHSQAQAEPNLARARRTIAELAAEKMHGRGYVQQGEHVAAAYLRGRLRQLGLQPLASDYTQPFTLDVNTFPGEIKLTVGPLGRATTQPDKEVYHLKPGLDFIAAPASSGTRQNTSSVAFRLDTLVFASHFKQQGLQQQIRQWNSLKDKLGSPFLVLTARDEKRLPTLPLLVQQTLDSIPNRVVLLPKLTASLNPTQNSAIRLEALDNPAIWRLRAHNGSAGLLKLTLDAQLIHNYPTQNLAAIVRGSAQPDSFLVVSAHYDHLGMMGRKTYFPGANDNASGVALLLELAAHYARPENRPACSVVFLLFGAEEAGLVGSTYFVQHPLVPLARIKFLLNLDLLGTGEDGATVVNGRVHEAAFRQFTALNDAHHYLPRLTARGRAANSDHFPFSEAGVPAFFLYTRGGSLAYHDVNDRPAALSLAGFAGAYGLARDFLDGLGAR
ncbi:VanZ family protein [Hymenobacter sp. H14-R3]|uniref:VanZ family protein n=1 Tax=Hymenobacter sp. H14-R3 TaxID=3046308 RepID=UPI0024BA820E|nr:VanZ family protein [Hymenobacter sp. H14-R3]MDJ0367146.1 VanZ family protein [Hymenobacter sp. H14-R3]